MRNATGAFKQALAEDKRDYINQATITLTDGTVLNVDNEQIWESGVSIEDAVSAENTFQVGAVIINQAKLVLNNIYDDFSPYDFTGASVVIYVGLEINGTPELLKMGTFEVDEAEYNGAIITLTCLDNMAKFDKPYTSQLVYPATLQEIVLDAYLNCLGSSSMGDSTFPSYQYQVAEKPSSESTTYRQVLSWAAQIAGCFARCDKDGKVRFGWYNTTAIDNLTLGLDGGVFDGGSGGTREILPYLNTFDGMTEITSTPVDDKWFDIPNSLGIEWGGTVYDKIYIDSDSCIAFSNTTPANHGHTSLRHINICTRDAKVYVIKAQVINTSSLSAVKIYWEGYTQYSSTAESRLLKYELFITTDGRIYINFIKLPDTTYRGNSSIIESGTSVSITPQDGVISARKEDGAWTIYTSAFPYQSGDAADGGSFNPWDTGYSYDAGSFTDVRDLHIISSAYSQNLSTDDVVITGVKVVKKIKSDSSSDAFEEYTYGESGYMVSVEGNEFIQGSHGQDVANTLGAALVGLTFRKAEITHPSDPTMEAGDVGIYFDRKGNQYTVLISSTDFTAGNSQRTCSSAETPRKNSAQRFSEATRNYVELRQQTEEKITAYDADMQRLVNLISNSFGMFETEETAQDGGKIYYIHDKPNLADSATIWKRTIDGFLVSTDGGVTWNAGMDASGNVLVNILSAIGINFSWAKGGTLTLGGGNNVNGSLRILNASGSQIGYWDNTGIHTSVGSFDGSIYSESGEIGGFTIANDSLYTESHSTVGSNSPGVYVGGAGVSCASSSSQKAIMSDGYIQLTTNIVSASSVGPACGLYLKTANEAYETHIAANMMMITYDNGVDEILETIFIADRSGIYTDGQKNRIVNTSDYNKRLLYCYETSAPMFGDVGEGEIGENGETRIYIDPVFAETISVDGYQVFLQKYGIGECYVSERNGAFFTVNGEPGLKFGWELKAKQLDLDQRRLDVFKQAADPEAHDYGADALNHIIEIEQERGITA